MDNPAYFLQHFLLSLNHYTLVCYSPFWTRPLHSTVFLPLLFPDFSFLYTQCVIFFKCVLAQCHKEFTDTKKLVLNKMFLIMMSAIGLFAFATSTNCRGISGIRDRPMWEIFWESPHHRDSCFLCINASSVHNHYLLSGVYYMVQGK